jgi:muramoyltetrapeptide carboxypeptidase
VRGPPWFAVGMEVLKPRAVRPGDTIGIVSTSSPVSGEELERLTGYLRGRGYRVKLADGVGEHTSWSTGWTTT